MKILIVEDEAGIVQFLKQGLEEEGYQVSTASDGFFGFELFKKESFDLVLLDWMLPKMNGLELCKAMRVKDKSIPILFLTAKDTIQETIEGLKAGANDYIKKPFSEEPLMGQMVYPNEYLLSKGINKDDFICFTPDSEYEFTVDGEKLYRMYDHQITMKL